MIKKIYSWFHRATSSPPVRGEYSGGYWQGLVRRETLLLCQGIQGRVLDVGCGEGLFLAELARQKPELKLWGVDNSKQRLELAEKRAREQNLKNITFSLQQAPGLAFEEGFFDAAVCINVFFNMESLASVSQTLSQMKRVCKTGAKIIFDFRNSQNPALRLKYKLARYYDDTVKGLPLKTYSPKQIDAILNELHLGTRGKRRLGFKLKSLAPIILVEAEKI